MVSQVFFIPQQNFLRLRGREVFISLEQSMHAMNCRTDTFEASDINNFTVERARIWERWQSKAKVYWIFFFNHNSTFNVFTAWKAGAECEVKEIPRLIVKVLSAKSTRLPSDQREFLMGRTQPRVAVPSSNLDDFYLCFPYFSSVIPGTR